MSRQADASELVEAVLELRTAIRVTREPATRARLRRVEARLLNLLGPSVSRRVAARALGISVTAIERWLNRGRLPLVRKGRSSRLEIETRPFLELAECVAALRDEGRVRPLAGAFRRLGWSDDPQGPQVLSEEVARLPRPNVTARELRAQYRSTTPGERVRQAAALSRSLTKLAGRSS